MAFHREVTVALYGKRKRTSTGKAMRDCERKLELRQRLSAVNAEWRALSREPSKHASRLARMEELRSERLVLMTALFEFEQRDERSQESALLRRIA